MSYGWKMPEESVAAVLRDGLAYVRASFANGSIDDLLSRVYVNIPDSARTEMRAWLAANEPRVTFSYPHDARLLPCWAIVIDPEDQAMDYVGDAGESAELENGDHVTITAERWRSTIGVIVHAENADLTRYLYQLARFLVGRARKVLSDEYPYEREMRGRDLQPVNVGGESGRLAFRRVLSITVEGDQTNVIAATGDIDAAETYPAAARGPHGSP